jgi:hypothetical protein
MIVVAAAAIAIAIHTDREAKANRRTVFLELENRSIAHRQALEEFRDVEGFDAELKKLKLMHDTAVKIAAAGDEAEAIKTLRLLIDQADKLAPLGNQITRAKEMRRQLDATTQLIGTILTPEEQYVFGIAAKTAEEAQAAFDTGRFSDARELWARALSLYELRRLSSGRELEELGVFSRDLTLEELRGQGAYIINDLVNKAAPLPWECKVTNFRVPLQPGLHAVKTYYAVSYDTDDDGDLVLVNDRPVERAKQIKKIIEEAVASFRKKTGQRTGSIDGPQFAAYAKGSPELSQAWAEMRKLRTLLSRIDCMGITPRESAYSRKTVIENLGVTNITTSDLQAAIGFERRWEDIRGEPAESVAKTLSSPLGPRREQLSVSVNNAHASNKEEPSCLMENFHLAYLTKIQSLPMDKLFNVEVELAATLDGFVAPTKDLKTFRFRLGDARSLPRQRFFRSALDTVLSTLVQQFEEAGYLGTLVVFDRSDIDEETGVDRRPPQKKTVDILIVQRNVVQIRTIAFSNRIPPDSRINHPLHAHILRDSPIRPFYKGDKGERRDVLLKQPLLDYLRKLSETPGRRVHAALASAEDSTGAVLDFLVFDNVGNSPPTSQPVRFPLISLGNE